MAVMLYLPCAKSKEKPSLSFVLLQKLDSVMEIIQLHFSGKLDLVTLIRF
jgi:hypothetical protein